MLPNVGLRQVYLPHYASLTLKNLGDYINDHQETHLYFPSAVQELKRLPRTWIITVIATVVGDDFLDWCQQRIEERNEEVKMKAGMMIELEPSVAAAFHASSAVSSKSFFSFLLTLLFSCS